ncbi:hypothetical protein PBY51_013798 [Eleginops maclovinus]|uniref:Uncharacterized protein n=1 Tax=Eleginops maclovinus TaxID=56733 RepID=A0AAN7Y910_ELEMC|nr:hypothetical protein PBY51_013798 [Eleginops maclovinus]
MGGEQSNEEKAEESQEEADQQKPPAHTDSSGPAAAGGTRDSPGELPQCQMGNRKVDNMCFMISCTNWY